MNQTKPSPDKITRLATGGWACAALGAAVTHRVFTHVDQGARTPDEIARAAGLSPRGTRALLDALVSVGLLAVSLGRYENSPEAREYLVEGKPSYFGGFAKFTASELDKWARLAEVVKLGAPAEDINLVENPFWEELVLSIAPMSFTVAQAAAKRLRVAEAGPIAILDVGGGSGVYSVVLLKASPRANSTQLDWPNVNRVARSYVAGHGVADRFQTIDGDFHNVDFGTGRYDVAIYSHIAHGESPQANVAVFRKLRAALKEGGTLVVIDFVQADDRSGPPFALLFHVNMLVHTQEGATYRESEYRAWLGESGFRDVAIEPTEGPASIIYAR
jgi:ubiquinone/menaquinone biosynthesis C-methylase UbiE